MSTELYYDNQRILTNQPTPFVGRQDSFIRFGERWADKTTLTLHGQITGCTPSLIKSAQNDLIAIFSNSFKSFRIVDNGSEVFSSNYTTNPRIDFPQSNYAYGLDYNVTLECYKENLFSGTYGVTDPSEEWSYEERDDYIVGLTHTISARGFQTNNTAFENAKNFVTSRVGLQNRVTPSFITGSLNFCLKDSSEKIDRFNGNYSVTERYLADSYYGLDGSLRYTSTFDCDPLEGISRVSVEGIVDGCNHSTSLDNLRNRYNNLNLYNMAAEGAPVGLNLNTAFLSNSITEDQYNKKITFKRTYDNNQDPVTYLDYSIGIEVSENEVTTVNFQGTIKGRGDINTRWINVQNFYSTVNPFSYASSIYNGSHTLNPVPINESTSFNPLEAEITISKTWDDKDLPPLGFKNFNYTLNFTPSLRKVGFTPLSRLCFVDYYVVDLNYNTRCSFSVNGNGKVCPPNLINNGVTNVKNFGNNQFALYCPYKGSVLDQKEISTTDQEVNFAFAWSAESNNSVNVQGGYGNVITLALK